MIKLYYPSAKELVNAMWWNHVLRQKIQITAFSGHVSHRAADMGAGGTKDKRIARRGKQTVQATPEGDSYKTAAKPWSRREKAWKRQQTAKHQKKTKTKKTWVRTSQGRSRRTSSPTGQEEPTPCTEHWQQKTTKKRGLDHDRVRDKLTLARPEERKSQRRELLCHPRGHVGLRSGHPTERRQNLIHREMTLTKRGLIIRERGWQVLQEISLDVRVNQGSGEKIRIKRRQRSTKVMRGGDNRVIPIPHPYPNHASVWDKKYNEDD